MKTAIDSINKKYSDLILGESITLEGCTEFLSYLESVIPEFFSRNGEAAGIHKMYDFISEGTDLKIECVDVRNSANIYTEYVDGMKAFIDEVKESGDINDFAQMKEIEVKLENASANDMIFIESIFGGAVNDKKETSITEASDNIEYLIEFIPEIGRYKSELEATTEAVNLTPKHSDNHEKLLMESLSMLYKSVATYCKDNVVNIFETYNNIIHEIDNPKESSETSDYKLVW
jgi:hypothetical protein